MSHSQRIFLVGTGSAGTALGLWLARRGHTLVGAWNRSVHGARFAAEKLPVPVAASDWPALPECDVVIVAVSDSAIGEVGRGLRPHLRPGMIVAHTSGALPASALGEQDVPRGSLHPLVAMRSPEVAADALNRSLITIEGEAEAVRRLQSLVEFCGARVQVIGAEGKTQYHAAAVMASNLAVALVAEASELAANAGVVDADQALAELAHVAVLNVVEHGLAAGLTGPISRGDTDTIRQHLGALNPETRSTYCALSLRALALAQQRGLDGQKVAEIRALLSQESRTQEA